MDVVGDAGFETHAYAIGHTAFRPFGDAAGKQRSSPTGQTDYDLLAERTKGLALEWNVLPSNPLVKDTVNAVRGRLSTADGQIQIHVHPRCKTLIEDMKTAPWPDPHNLRHFHALACLRYYCHRLFGRNSGVVSTSPLTIPNLGGGQNDRR